jgi:cytochrome c553
MNIRQWFRCGSALLCAVLPIVTALRAQERASAPAIVTQSCSGCHGINGNSQLPNVPRLAGLRTEYLENRIGSFRAAAVSPVDETFNRVVHFGSASRISGITPAATSQMVGIANATSDDDIKAAVQWFANQAPPRSRGDKGKWVEEGKTLFFNGNQSQGLVACQACHGPEAQGTDKAPRLAGQNAAYIVGQLALFRAGASTTPEMAAVARSLDAGQTRAVAAYLHSR